MTLLKSKSKHLMRVILLGLSLLLTVPVSLTAPSQDDEESGSRHICPEEAIRNGTCSPKGPAKSQAGARKRQPRYTRVAKQPSTAAKCNVRVKQTQTAKNQSGCQLATPASQGDLPLSSPRVGVTIWRVKEAERDYSGARILSHPGESRPAIEYQSARIKGDPVLTYGERVRLGIESPRDGFLYVFNRELYHDGSLSAPYMIFPTARLRSGDNRIRANRPIELPAATDRPFYFEASRIGIDPRKRLVGEILSIAITDERISNLPDLDSNATVISAADMEAIEKLYAGRAEVFELENGIGQVYSNVEHDVARSDSRMLTHADPVPQTFFLVDNKRSSGLLVTVALSYRNTERVSQVGLKNAYSNKRRGP